MKNNLSCILVYSVAASLLAQTPDSQAPKVDAASGTPASVTSTPKPSILPEVDKLENAASQISLDISRLHIEKWKTGSVAKSGAQANCDSVQRNLSSALPALIAAVRADSENLSAEFKLYRNVYALSEVVSSLVDATRAFGSNSDSEALAQQLQMLNSVRRNLGESLEQLTAAQQQELNQARSQIKAQQEQLAAAQAATTEARKQLELAQAEPPKKPAAKKKPVAKKSTTPSSGSNSTSPSQTSASSPSPKP